MKYANLKAVALFLVLFADAASADEARIQFESLPLDLAVKVQRGKGSRVLAMFSDPYCPALEQASIR